MLNFLSPWLLWGLGALALPVIAHLIHRRIRQTIKFPSLRFIQSGSLRQQGRRRPRDLILLLLRLLLLAAAIIALARPQWLVERDPAEIAAQKAARSLVVIADRSASMSGWNSPAQARAVLGNFLSENEFDQADLLFTANGLVGDIRQNLNRQRLLETLAQTEPMLQAGQPREALGQAAALLSGNTGGEKHLAILSDFQQSDWQSAAASLGEDVQLHFLPTGLASDEWDDDPRNIGILSALSLPAGEDQRRVLVEVRNFGVGAEEREVIVEIGGESWATEVQLEPGETLTETFEVPTTEDNRGRVTLAPADAYTPDDSFLFWAGAPPPAPVIAVLPERDLTGKQVELLFLRTALAVKDPNARLSFQVDSLPAPAVIQDVLNRTRGLILLSSTAELREEVLADLPAYLENGGMALATLGESASLQLRSLNAAGITQSTYQGMRGRGLGVADQPFRMAPPVEGSWLAEKFEDESARDFDLLEIYRYAVVEPGPNAQVLAETEQGDPLLLRVPVGNGVLFLSTFDFNPEWSDLPLRNAFVPLIREIFQEAAPQDLGVIRLATGDQPDPASQPALRAIPQEELGNLATDRPSVQLLGGFPVTVNVPRSESITQTVPFSDLRVGLNTAPLVPETAGAAPRIANETQQIIDLWPWFAGLAVILFLIELLYATWKSRDLLKTAPANPR